MGRQIVLTKALSFAVLLSLSACGFEPLYGSSKTSTQTSSAYTLQITGNSNDAYTQYKFRQELEPLLNRTLINLPQKLRIAIAITEEYGDIGYGADAASIRSQGHMTAVIKLYNGQSLDPVHSNSVDVVSSYTIDHSEEFSNLNAKDSTRERLITSLAQDTAHEIRRAVIR
ncbi:MAG: hypothetical protein NTX76_02920 [Alphaproteobacteria bacterium]|nr:hypothetical protein [Alphaproteobacteria bacterium]